ncbi:MAG: heavy-metal-associated domain-containing protein [Candidatus Hydrogenedentes bacterium]|nr:heavy-metal-associated domain-containing protein [Candidatus Hydrogenedentota bacterium]
MLRVAISGMTCEGCAMAAKKKLEAVPSVQSVRVSLSKQEAIVVALEDETFVRQRILTALGNVGFTGSFPEESNDSLAR